MTLGTQNKKSLWALGILGVIMAYTFYDNVLSGPSTPSASASRTSNPSPTAQIRPASDQPVAPRAPQKARTEDWHPVWRPKRLEDRVAADKIDPTLHIDRLAKVMSVELTGGSRNLFAFSTPPPKPAEMPKGPEPKILKYGPNPLPPPPPPTPPAPEPPPPPITLKFYGYSRVRRDGRMTAYFLDGDEPLIATEGETVKKHYKVVKISATSVLMEDTDSKRQQSIPLTPEEKS